MMHHLSWVIDKKHEEHEACFFRVGFYRNEFLWCMYTGRGVYLMGFSRYVLWAAAFIGAAAPGFLASIWALYKNQNLSYGIHNLFVITGGWFLLTLGVELFIFVARVPRPSLDE